MTRISRSQLSVLGTQVTDKWGHLPSVVHHCGIIYFMSWWNTYAMVRWDLQLVLCVRYNIECDLHLQFV